jgi:hypothetical protein
MSTREDGGPAFANMTANSCGPVNPRREGMSLLDYAAVHADISSLEFGNVYTLATFVGVDPLSVTHDTDTLLCLAARAAAKARYMFAEAFIAERAARTRSTEQEG